MENVLGVMMVLVVVVGMFLPKFPGLMPLPLVVKNGPEYMEMH